MNSTARRAKIAVSADGRGLVSQAGMVLLAEAVRVTGLGRGLVDGLAAWRAPRAVHDPGKIITDLVMTLALGGDCLADVAVLRAQPQLCGPVASDPVISRLISALAADAPRALRAIRKARAAARERAWALAGDAAPGADGSLVPVDIDATIVLAHSEKEHAAPTWKKTFGFHPLAAFADHGAGAGGEALAIVLRPGNAGSNTAAEHIEAARLALAQLPRGPRRLSYARTAHAPRGHLADTAGAIAMATCQAAHTVLAGCGQWVTNDKTLIDQAGLCGIDVILDALTPEPARVPAAVEQAERLISKSSR